jgi:hypothetical protein
MTFKNNTKNASYRFYCFKEDELNVPVAISTKTIGHVGGAHPDHRQRLQHRRRPGAGSDH